MPVTVKIPTQLRSVTGGDAETVVDGATVGGVLDALYDRYGDLRERITDPTTGSAGGARDSDTGGDGARRLRRFVNVYVDGEDIRFLEGLDTEVPDGGEVTILPAVAGG